MCSATIYNLTQHQYFIIHHHFSFATSSSGKKAGVPDWGCFPCLLAETNPQGGHLIWQPHSNITEPDLPHSIDAAQASSLQSQAVLAGNTAQLRPWPYCSVAESKMMSCCIWSSCSTGSIWAPCQTTWLLSCRLCCHPLPKGRSKCNKILLLLFSLPFQTMYSVCCASVQREAAQSRMPCSLVGSGDVWGVFELRGVNLIVQAKGREGCWPRLCLGGVQPFPHASSVEVYYCK